MLLKIFYKKYIWGEDSGVRGRSWGGGGGRWGAGRGWEGEERKNVKNSEGGMEKEEMRAPLREGMRETNFKRAGGVGKGGRVEAYPRLPLIYCSDMRY